jgi:type VI protein secretion system component VasF
VIEVFALCLALGFRGKYEARDIAGYEAIRKRLYAKLSSNLALIDGPPQLPPAPWPARHRPNHLPLWIAATAALFTAALLLQARAETTRLAESLRADLESRDKQ